LIHFTGFEHGKTPKYAHVYWSGLRLFSKLNKNIIVLLDVIVTAGAKRTFLEHNIA